MFMDKTVFFIFIFILNEQNESNLNRNKNYFTANNYLMLFLLCDLKFFFLLL